MKKKNQRLIIPFVGLKEGFHHFDFEVGQEFFEQFEFSIIKDAVYKIAVDFEKKKNLFNLQFVLKGVIKTFCDRCNDPIEIKTKGKNELIVKFGEELFSETDEIKIISPTAFELDLTAEVYDFIHLQLPTKIEHKKIENCNQEIIEKLEALNTKEERKEGDPRWSALQKLKDKND